jgi:hypothetical protein
MYILFLKKNSQFHLLIKFSSRSENAGKWVDNFNTFMYDNGPSCNFHWERFQMRTFLQFYVSSWFQSISSGWNRSFDFVANTCWRVSLVNPDKEIFVSFRKWLLVVWHSIPTMNTKLLPLFQPDEAAGFPETSVPFCHSTWHYNP